MTEEEIYKQLNELFVKVFKRSDIVINAETSAKDIPEWTSLTYMTLVFEIEQEFGFKIKLKNMMMWQKVGDMVQTINKKINGN
jgi:acyl carrier protein